MMHFARRMLSGFGRGLRVGLVAIGALAFTGSVIAVADYSLTQGSGTTFASLVISSKHYVAHVLCDATLGESQCQAVNASGSAQVDWTTGSQAHADLTAATPCLNATTSTTNSYSNTQTNPFNCDLHGNLYVSVGSGDPCLAGAKSGAPINLTASGQVITGTASKKTYICSIDIVSATAQNIALVEGTGSTCATNIFGLAGGTTAATGWNLSANGGLTKGGGVGTVYSPSADANATAANVCLLLSSTGQTSGQITYVQQ